MMMDDQDLAAVYVHPEAPPPIEEQNILYAHPDAPDPHPVTDHHDNDDVDTSVHTQLPLPSIRFPANHGTMGGNPFGEDSPISKHDLFKMAGYESPNWWGRHPEG